MTKTTTTSGRRPCALACLLFAAAALPAQDVVPDPALRARFGFVGPDIRKVSDQVAGLTVVDLDGDGRDEVLVFDGERARFSIYSASARRRPEGPGVDDVDYTVRHVESEGRTFGHAVADVDGDGTPDLVFLDRRGRLVTVPQGGTGTRRLLEVGLGARSDSVRAGDLDGDGRSELLVATRAGIRVVRDVLGTSPEISPAIPLGARRFGMFETMDFDGDGALDLVLGVNVPRTPLWVRLGAGDGTFGGWVLLPLDAFQIGFPATSRGPARTLGAVDNDQWRFTEYALRRSEEPVRPGLGFESMEPITRGAFPFVQTDADGDGTRDLVLAHPERAELTYLLERGGRFERVTVPTLDGVDSLSAGDVDGDGDDDLVLVSSSEKVVGWRRGGDPLDRFPTALKLPDGRTPYAAVAAPAAASGDGPAAVDVLMREDRKRQGEVWRIAADADADAEPTELVAMDRISSGPLRIATDDVDGDGVRDLAFVLPGDGLCVLPGTGDGGSYGTRAGSAGFTERVEDGAVSFPAPGGADGSASVFVVRERYARWVRPTPDGRLVVERQMNAPAGAQLALGAVRPASADGDAAETVYFLDRESNKLYTLREGAPATTVDVPGIGATHVLLHGRDVLVVGREGVVRVPADAAWQLDAVRSVPRLGEESRPFAGTCADLDGDGTSEALLVDEEFNGVHVLVAADTAWEPALAFPVFEVGQKFEPIWEPDEIATGDLDGDGRTDLVLLSHDRILMYRQPD